MKLQWHDKIHSEHWTIFQIRHLKNGQNKGVRIGQRWDSWAFEYTWIKSYVSHVFDFDVFHFCLSTISICGSIWGFFFQFISCALYKTNTTALLRTTICLKFNYWNLKYIYEIKEEEKKIQIQWMWNLPINRIFLEWIANVLLLKNSAYRVIETVLSSDIEKSVARIYIILYFIIDIVGEFRHPFYCIEYINVFQIQELKRTNRKITHFIILNTI